MGSFSFAFTKDAFFVCAFLCIMLLDAAWAGEGRFPCQPHGMVSQDHSRLVSVVIRCTLHTCHLWNVWLLWLDMSAVWQVCVTWNDSDVADLYMRHEMSAIWQMHVTWLWCGRYSRVWDLKCQQCVICMWLGGVADVSDFTLISVAEVCDVLGPADCQKSLHLLLCFWSYF